MFSDIKVGDEVVKKHHIGNERKYHLLRVDRVTKTLIIAGNKRFKKDTGDLYPRSNSRWAWSDSIYLVNDETIEKVKQTSIRSKADKLNNINFGKLVSSQPDFIETIYKQVMAKMKNITPN